VLDHVKRRARLALGLALASFATSGCGFPAANWYDTRRVSGYVVPASIPLVVDTSDFVVRSDPGGYIDTMVLTLRDELGERGVTASILRPKPSKLPSPRVELIIRSFQEGDFGESYGSSLVFIAPVAGQGEIALTCRAYSASNELMFEGTLKGSIAGMGDTRDLAEVAGTTIAEGLTNPESTRPVARTEVVR
jgi:hypothetical protein